MRLCCAGGTHAPDPLPENVVALTVPFTVWLALNVLAALSCANALADSPPNCEAFTLVNPEPLPEKLVAVIVPFTA